MRAVGIMAMALLLASSAAVAQTKQKEPTCRADRRGDDLVTTIEYPNGYVVEGPWRVTSLGTERGTRMTITAVLDRIVEIHATSSRRQMTPLPGLVEMTFRGATSTAVLAEAAQVWCATIIQAHPPVPVSPPLEVVSQARIT